MFENIFVAHDGSVRAIPGTILNHMPAGVRVSFDGHGRITDIASSDVKRQLREIENCDLVSDDDDSISAIRSAQPSQMSDVLC